VRELRELRDLLTAGPGPGLGTAGTAQWTGIRKTAGQGANPRPAVVHAVPAVRSRSTRIKNRGGWKRVPSHSARFSAQCPPFPGPCPP